MMCKEKSFVLIIVAVLFALGIYSGIVHAEPDIYTEIRYQGKPIRDADGKIVRSKRVLSAFKKIHPCPSTMRISGACSGWAIDHVISLDCGGIDAVWNLQWLPDDMKSGSDPHNKDRFERKIYAAITPFPDTAKCKNEVVK